MTNLIKAKIEANNTVVKMTMNEAVAYTGHKKSYLYKLVHLRKIPAHKSPNGSMLTFEKAELDNWLFARTLLTVAELEQSIV